MQSAAASVAASVKASASGEACSAFAELKTSTDLKSTPLDTSGTRVQIAAQAADLGVKAATVKANISRLSALSDGPVAAAVGELNKKADALSESLTLAVADGQEEIGPKITAAQSEPRRRLLRREHEDRRALPGRVGLAQTGFRLAGLAHEPAPLLDPTHTTPVL